MRNDTPIEFRQLCAVVKTVLQQEPSIDDAEWKARSRETLAKLGFAEPDAAMLVRAMTQVEYALSKTIGLRPVRAIPMPVQTLAPTVPDPPIDSRRTKTPAGWAIVVALMTKLQRGAVSDRSSTPPPKPRDTLTIGEEEALNEFWGAVARGDDRLALLRAFAEIAIVRPAGWSVEAIRAEGPDPRLRADACFGCLWEGWHWHHVIQIQHGGSNYIRNFVPLCRTCHGAVHPWLDQSAPRRTDGWSQIGECAPAHVERLRKQAVHG
jgi:hypothetical protein